MFTVCPKCSLKLVVTAADLRVAQGYVRCGRCSNVFNALIGLSDEQQAVLAREAANAEGSDEGSEEREESVSDAALEFDPSQTDVSEVFVELGAEESGSGSFESITLRTEEIPAAARSEPSGHQPEVAAPATPGAPDQAGRSVASVESKLATPRIETASQPEVRAQHDARIPPESRVPQHAQTDASTPTVSSTPADAEVHEFELPDPDATERSTPAAGAASKTVPVTTSRDAPAATPQVEPAATSQVAPAARPKAEPAATPKAAPAATPKAAPGTTPNAAAAAAAKVAPGSTPKAVPAAAPKIAPPGAAGRDAAAASTIAPPGATAKDAPSAAPKAAPRAAPKVAPGADEPRAASTQTVAWNSTQSSPGARLAAARAVPSGVASRVAILRRTERDKHGAASIEDSPADPIVDPSVSAPIVDAFGAAPAPHAPATAVPLYEQWLLRAAVAILGVLLAAQVVHHYRAALADVDWLGPPLTAIYAALGMPLVPRWDVAAYEVHQLGAIAGADQSGGLIVRASIKNTAPRPQPLPLLRVTLQDRFGNHVAARDVPPQAYLPARSAERVYLAPGQRVDAEVQLVDPGAAAVGFEIDACLKDSTGRVSCANDASGASVEP
jgi:predicted Zn finger-like uncharacterized protein